MPALVDTLHGFLRDRDIGAIVLAGSERPLAARAAVNEAESLSRIDFAFGAERSSEMCCKQSAGRRSHVVSGCCPAVDRRSITRRVFEMLSSVLSRLADPDPRSASGSYPQVSPRVRRPKLGSEVCSRDRRDDLSRLTRDRAWSSPAV